MTKIVYANPNCKKWIAITIFSFNHLETISG